jgi:hypothetical protein
VKIEQKLAGRILGMRVYDVVYSLNPVIEDGKGKVMKSVIVEGSPNQFHEIWVMQTLGETLPSGIVSAGDRQILTTAYTDGGYQGYVWKEHFVFSAAGAIRLDDEPVRSAAGDLIPEGFRIWPPSSVFDFASFTWVSWAIGENEALCCSGGKVTVKFRIDSEGRIVVTNANYDDNEGGLR